MKLIRKSIYSFCIVIISLLCTYGLQAQKAVSITVHESINPASAEYILEGIKKAETDNAACLIINLNTPGGMLNSTREIVTNIMASKVPVVVYISPSGSRAGSAGVFITMAANIAVMAPGTNIGAAHPVDMQGKAGGVMNEKITNDAAAFIRSIAMQRNRNQLWAEDAIRLSVSITEKEALEENVVNLIADNQTQLLRKIDGLTVNTADGPVVLRTANVQIDEMQMGFFLKVLSRISDPNIAYILMMLGFFGLIFELFNPGALFPGIIGVIALILAFYTMSSLPVNYAAIALIVFGIVLYLLEIKIVSHGMLAIGGTVSVLLGSMFLFRTSSVEAVSSLSWAVIITTTAVSLLFFLFVVGMGLKAQRAKPVSGGSALIGMKGVALSEIGEQGMVRVMGESWRAFTEGAPLAAGSDVIINEVKGLTLRVSADNSALQKTV